MNIIGIIFIALIFFKLSHVLDKNKSIKKNVKILVIFAALVVISISILCANTQQTEALVQAFSDFSSSLR